MEWMTLEQLVESYSPEEPPKESKDSEVTIAYQILKALDDLEHNTASTQPDDLKKRAKAVKTIKELANSILEKHGAQHD